MLTFGKAARAASCEQETVLDKAIVGSSVSSSERGGWSAGRKQLNDVRSGLRVREADVPPHSDRQSRTLP
jgi:hypothetical protein